VSPDVRLAGVVGALEAVGISCLVMGGHAVRFYGLSRHTNDVDLHVSPDPWGDLPARLAGTNLFGGQAVREGPSWRPGAFRRFKIGTLPDGREEWLEFWRENHLLAPHDELRTRAERGPYGGQEINFLGLDDLIRSKETERDADWQDVTVLEQFLDARLLTRVRSGTVPVEEALASLRSQTGLLGYLEAGLLTAPNAGAALARTTNPVTQTILIPFAPPDALASEPGTPIEPVVLARLRATPPASPLHLALVEVVRRRYIAFRKDVDRRDKEMIRAKQP
jgi:hypothetical protein